jgi:hypothetical protein
VFKRNILPLPSGYNSSMNLEKVCLSEKFVHIHMVTPYPNTEDIVGLGIVFNHTDYIKHT